MEKKGRWIPLTQKSDYELYFNECEWLEQMFDRCVSIQELKLLKERHVFNCKTNHKGVVRDHMYSRRSGFEYKVFPEILRHPCNCQLITHSDNSKKREQNDVTLNELFLQIQMYKREWLEQKKCLELIKEYKKGRRWKRVEM